LGLIAFNPAARASFQAGLPMAGHWLSASRRRRPIEGGTGFDGSAANNNVTIGGVTCNVTAATSTQITCTLGNGPTGVRNVVVNVLGQGQASGTVTFTYTSDITSISPTSGSIGGKLV